MNTRIIWAIALAGIIGLFSPRATRADEPAPLPACATDGDKDGDGVPDDQDNAETDSCTASSSGFEDCQTGAGDGMPDCQ